MRGGGPSSVGRTYTHIDCTKLYLGFVFRVYDQVLELKLFRWLSMASAPNSAYSKLAE